MELCRIWAPGGVRFEVEMTLRGSVLAGQMGEIDLLFKIAAGVVKSGDPAAGALRCLIVAAPRRPGQVTSR
jgi:hypothetical protein